MYRVGVHGGEDDRLSEFQVEAPEFTELLLSLVSMVVSARRRGSK